VGFLKRQGLRIPPELQAAAAPTVLLVDDDPGVGPWLSQVLISQRPDCRVLLAQDGYSAGEAVTAERPDVVILDLYMPGLDGFAVCRKIKSRPATRKTVVIAITAHFSPEAEKAILDAGAAACLAKPIDTTALRRLLDRMLPSKR
jgi:CheY-like chemotaxis protein